MYELAVWIKMFHMTFSPSHNRGKVVHLVYKPQLSRKFNYNCLYTIDTHSYLINQFKQFYKVYELAVCIKMFHMTFSRSHNRGKVVQLVYKHSIAANLPIITYTALSLLPPTDIYVTN